MTFKETAIRAAKTAAKIHLKYFNTKLKIKHKSGFHDRVTIADTESEKKFRRPLAQAMDLVPLPGDCVR